MNAMPGETLPEETLQGATPPEETLHRAFVSEQLMARLDAEGRIPLPTDVAKRFLKVLRLGNGDRAVLLDGRGRVATVLLHKDPALQTEPAQAELVHLETRGEDHPAVTIAQAAVRLSKLEEVVRRGTELGAARFIIFHAARSQLGPGRLGEKKLERLRRVAEDAVRQSGRVCTPPVLVISQAELLQEIRRAQEKKTAVVMGILGAKTSLTSALKTSKSEAGFCLVGPEGGFSSDEEAAFAAAGAIAVSLGCHTLRAETASLAALAAFQTSWGRL